MARRLKRTKSALARRRTKRRKSQYKDYERKYYAKAEMLAKRGLSMAWPKLDYRSYKEARAEKLEDLKYDISTGRRKRIGDINSILVSDDAYELSQRKGEVLLDYFLKNEPEIMEKLGIDYSFYTDESGSVKLNLKSKIEALIKIRQGNFIKYDVGYWDMINDFRDKWFASSKELKNELIKKWGADTFEQALKAEVGVTFFDSPE